MLERKRVVVTGASGFLGLNVVEALSVAGHETHAYARATSNVSYLASLSARLHTGELSDAARLREAMKGVDAVIHCGTMSGCHEPDDPRLRVANIEGTQAVIDAAVECGVRRFVYTSTTATIGAADDPARQWNEEMRPGDALAESVYARTKAEAETIVRGAIVRGLDTIILNPAEVIGAWDYPMHWGRMVLGVATGRVPFVPAGTGSFCSAREVGRAHVSALTRGAIGARYILAGTDATYADLIDTIALVAGVARPPAEASGTSERLLDPYRAALLAGHYRFDASRAVRDLDYRVVPLVDIVREAYDWYRAHGFIAAPRRGRKAPVTSPS